MAGRLRASRQRLLKRGRRGCSRRWRRSGRSSRTLCRLPCPLSRAPSSLQRLSRWHEHASLPLHANSVLPSWAGKHSRQSVALLQGSKEAEELQGEVERLSDALKAAQAAALEVEHARDRLEAEKESRSLQVRAAAARLLFA